MKSNYRNDTQPHFSIKDTTNSLLSSLFLIPALVEVNIARILRNAKGFYYEMCLRQQVRGHK